MIETIFKFVDKFLKWPPVINWRTTLGGLIALAGVFIDVGNAILTKKSPNWDIDLGLLGMFWTGLNAKDHSTTGGSVSAVTGASGPPVSLIEEVKKI